MVHTTSKNGKFVTKSATQCSANTTVAYGMLMRLHFSAIHEG
jgi:hypothetical protein